jgi:hypothetical protein
MGGVGSRVMAVAGLAAGLALFLAVTTPPVDEEIDSSVRWRGGVCLQLERWTLFGWDTVGHTHTVEDTRKSNWKPAAADPPCADVPERDYLIRVFTEPPGIYQLCSLVDDDACIQFRRAVP